MVMIMGNQSAPTKRARELEKLYDTKAHGTNHTTVLRLVLDHGFEGAAKQLEAWGMTASPTAGRTGPK